MVHPLLRQVYDLLPETTRDLVKAKVKPAVARRRSMRAMQALLCQDLQLTGVEPAISPVPASIDDNQIVPRLMTAYRRAISEAQATGDSMWTAFFEEKHGAIHHILMSDDVTAATSLFRNPGQTDFFYGFDTLVPEWLDYAKSPAWRDLNARVAVDGLARFAIAAGLLRAPYPDAYAMGYGQRPNLDAASLIAAIESETGQALRFPNPYPDEHGAQTMRGILSYRVNQALYQARRIKELTHGLANPRVLEIGGGLGRTAFYARALGIRDYTIVDLPITAAAQGYFLARTLGDAEIALLGEAEIAEAKRIKLVSPQHFLNGSHSYDLIINADSLTEMARDVAQAYIAKIAACTSVFLSINHEFNSFTVRDIMRETYPDVPFTRHVYAMRDGYLEESCRFR